MLFATLKLTQLWLRNLAEAYSYRREFAYYVSSQIELREIAGGLNACANAFHYFIQPSNP